MMNSGTRRLAGGVDTLPGGGGERPVAGFEGIQGVILHGRDLPGRKLPLRTVKRLAHPYKSGSRN